jgi:hypothetical protein
MDDVEIDYNEDGRDIEYIFLTDEEFIYIQKLKRAVDLDDMEPLDVAGEPNPKDPSLGRLHIHYMASGETWKLHQQVVLSILIDP